MKRLEPIELMIHAINKEYDVDTVADVIQFDQHCFKLLNDDLMNYHCILYENNVNCMFMLESKNKIKINRIKINISFILTSRNIVSIQITHNVFKMSNFTKFRLTIVQLIDFVDYFCYTTFKNKAIANEELTKRLYSYE